MWLLTLALYLLSSGITEGRLTPPPLPFPPADIQGEGYKYVNLTVNMGNRTYRWYTRHWQDYYGSPIWGTNSQRDGSGSMLGIVASRILMYGQYMGLHYGAYIEIEIEGQSYIYGPFESDATVNLNYYGPGGNDFNVEITGNFRAFYLGNASYSLYQSTEENYVLENDGEIEWFRPEVISNSVNLTRLTTNRTLDINSQNGTLGNYVVTWGGEQYWVPTISNNFAYGQYFVTQTNNVTYNNYIVAPYTFYQQGGVTYANAGGVTFSYLSRDGEVNMPWLDERPVLLRSGQPGPLPTPTPSPTPSPTPTPTPPPGDGDGGGEGGDPGEQPSPVPTPVPFSFFSDFYGSMFEGQPTYDGLPSDLTLGGGGSNLWVISWGPYQVDLYPLRNSAVADIANWFRRMVSMIVLGVFASYLIALYYGRVVDIYHTPQFQNGGRVDLPLIGEAPSLSIAIAVSLFLVAAGSAFLVGWLSYLDMVNPYITQISLSEVLSGVNVYIFEAVSLLDKFFPLSLILTSVATGLIHKLTSGVVAAGVINLFRFFSTR